jgi:hypothetical protein
MREDEVRVSMFLKAFDFDRAEWEVFGTEDGLGELTCYYEGKDEPFGASEFVTGSLVKAAWAITEDWLYYNTVPATKYVVEKDPA